MNAENIISLVIFLWLLGFLLVLRFVRNCD
jgi:hypothetical protein